MNKKRNALTSADGRFRKPVTLGMYDASVMPPTVRKGAKMETRIGRYFGHKSVEEELIAAGRRVANAEAELVEKVNRIRELHMLLGRVEERWTWALRSLEVMQSLLDPDSLKCCVCWEISFICRRCTASANGVRCRAVLCDACHSRLSILDRIPCPLCRRAFQDAKDHRGRTLEPIGSVRDPGEDALLAAPDELDDFSD